MRKILAFTCAVVFALSLCACKTNNAASSDTKSEETSSVVSNVSSKAEESSSNVESEEAANNGEMSLTEDDVEELMEKIGKNEKVDFSKYNQAEKDFIKKCVKKSGVDMTFHDNGAVIMTEKDATLQIGGPAVENEFTKGLPQIPGTVNMAAIQGKTYSVILEEDVTIDQLKEYTAKLKTAGYDKNVTEGSQDEIYSFEAKNKDGVKVSVAVAKDMKVVMFEKK